VAKTSVPLVPFERSRQYIDVIIQHLYGISGTGTVSHKHEGPVENCKLATIQIYLFSHVVQVERWSWLEISIKPIPFKSNICKLTPATNYIPRTMPRRLRTIPGPSRLSGILAHLTKPPRLELQSAVTKLRVSYKLKNGDFGARLVVSLFF
jgi:hypothetical protein